MSDSPHTPAEKQPTSTHGHDPLPVIIGLIALLSSGRVWSLQDGIWDDNTWLFSIYFTDNLQGYLNTGFVEMRRELLGTFFYYFFLLHKHTDFFYPVLHAINLTSQVMCPIMLYWLIRSLFENRRPLAFLIAMSMIAFPLDHTLSYVSAVNYRISLLLSLFSLFATERALNGGQIRYAHFAVALITAGLSYYVFLEARVALEPARLLIIRLALSRTASARAATLATALRYWLPFVLLALLLAYYKHAYKPYGLYEGVYSFDPFFFVNVNAVLGNLKDIWNYHWREFAQARLLPNHLAAVLGLGAAGLSLVALRHLSPFLHSGKAGASPRHGSLTNILDGEWPVVRTSLLLGAAFFVPPAALSMYAHLPFVGDQHNTHASLIQIGAACILGTACYLPYHMSAHMKRPLLVSTCLALLLGTGVFFNNKYLDLYAHSWDEQSRFLNVFLKRFPSLPDHAIFFFDVRTNALFSDLRNPIDFEFPLSLLYATSTDSKNFRRYLASTLEEYRSYHPAEDRWTNPNSAAVTRRTRWGTETLPWSTSSLSDTGTVRCL